VHTATHITEHARGFFLSTSHAITAQEELCTPMPLHFTPPQDPYVVASFLTSGTFNFGATRGEKLVAAVLLMVIGGA
jgi:hypothetical protein